MTNRRLARRTLLAWAVLELVAAAQVRGPEEVTLLSRWIRTAVEPAASVIVSSTLWFTAQTTRLSDSYRLASENTSLRRSVESLESANALLEAELQTMRQGNVGFNLLGRTTAVPARCVARDLGRGTLQLRLPPEMPGAAPVDTPVFSSGGVVGRVIRSGGRTCWVETIVNPAAAVAVTSDDGSVQALAEGAGDGLLNIRFVPQRASLMVGDRLYSSGGDGVYPPGLPVADVLSVRETGDLFLEIRAQSVADIPAVRMAWLVRGSNHDPMQTEDQP